MNQRLGTFLDAWDPTELLEQNGFECVLGCDSVLACGDSPDGDDGDLRLRLVYTNEHRSWQQLVDVRGGRVRLLALGEALQTQWQIPGNQHQGDQGDVQRLSQALNVGILMFCDGLQNDGRDCLYNIGSQQEEYPFWISLWWDEPVHFRLAMLCFGDDSEDPAKDTSLCFWSADQLPPSFLEQYRRCNRLAN